MRRKRVEKRGKVGRIVIVRCRIMERIRAKKVRGMIGRKVAVR
jgi:hypothetical protein